MRHESARVLSKTQGFTLIELVVAFSIMAILSTIGIASFVSYSQAQTLQQAENSLVTTLNTARSLSGAQVASYQVDNNTTLKCPANTSFDGYGVQITTPRSYNLYISCSNTPTLAPTVNLPSNRLSFTNNSNVFFPILTGGVVGAGDIVISSSYTTPATTKTIHIDAGGNMSTP